LLSSFNYTQNSAVANNIMMTGITFAGGIIGSGANNLDTDLYYPNSTFQPSLANYNVPEVDNCMTEIEPGGLIASHMLGACHKYGASDYLTAGGVKC